MTTDENLLDIMLVRATNPEQETVDELSVQMFCMVLRSNSQLIPKAHEILMSKIRSSNVMEATRAIELLEECMAKCGDEFQHETSKNVFLNNLIRLVSPKFDGPDTPAEIKQRIMKCLLLWTTEYPSRQKISAVYDMLSKEYVAEPEKTNNNINKRDNLLGIDEEKLVNLIRSKDPENYKRANMLIQCRVSQETRRKDLIIQQKKQIQEVDNIIELLGQLLDNYEKEKSKKHQQDADTLILLKELYLDCKKHKPIMHHLPELIENTEEELIAEALQTNDLLIAVMKRYKNLVKYQPTQTDENNSSTVTEKFLTNSSNSDLLADLLGDNSNDAAISTAKKDETISSEQIKDTNASVFDDWSKFFDDKKPTATIKNYEDIFKHLDLLEPVKVVETTTDTQSEQKQSKPALRELREIDKISEDLFKENLHTNIRIGSFNKEADKITLNDLVKEKQNVKLQTAIDSPSHNIETKENIAVISPSKDVVQQMTDEEILDITNEETESNKKNLVDENKEINSKHLENAEKIIYLSEINLDLNDVLLTFKDRVLTVTDDNVIITLHFTKNRPSKDVGVIVVSVTNLGKMHVKDFQFEASVKKPCKVRLLEPNRCDMPPCSKTAAQSIKQVMLLLNPIGSAVDVTCIFGYKLNEDPDPVKESIVAKDIALFE